jgi:ABC-type glycerol-3-phosphate transport system substrate-binding protein
VTGLMEQNVLHTVSASGSYYYDADKLKMSTNDPAFRKALKFQYDLFHEGLAIGPPEAKVKGYQSTDLLYVDNKYPLMLELSWMLKTIMTRSAQKGSTVNPADYDVIPWPHWKDSPDQGSSVLSFNGWAISKDCKNPKLAFEVLKYSVLNFSNNMSKAGVDNLYCRKDAISNQKMVKTYPGLKNILKRKTAPRPKMLLDIDDYIQTKVVRAALESASVSDMTFEQLLERIDHEGQKVIDDYARNKK